MGDCECELCKPKKRKKKREVGVLPERTTK